MVSPKCPIGFSSQRIACLTHLYRDAPDSYCAENPANLKAGYRRL